MIMKRPQESASGAGLLAPFHETVWYFILVSLIITGPAIWGIIWMYHRFGKHTGEPYYNLWQCCWYAYGESLALNVKNVPRFNIIQTNRRVNETRIYSITQLRLHSCRLCNLVDLHHGSHEFLHGQPDSFLDFGSLLTPHQRGSRPRRQTSSFCFSTGICRRVCDNKCEFCIFGYSQ